MVESWKERVETLKQEVHALFLAYRRPETPVAAKVVAVIVVAYALSHVDLIPDFIPIIGYLDDLVLLPLGIALAIWLIPSEVLEQCRAEARGSGLRPGRLGYGAGGLDRSHLAGHAWLARVRGPQAARRTMSGSDGRRATPEQAMERVVSSASEGAVT